MDVVDDVLAAFAKKKRNGDQLRVMKMVDIRVQAFCGLKHLPNGSRHSCESRTMLLDRPDAHLFFHSVQGMRADNGDIESGAGERPALFLEDARIQRAMDGRQMNDFKAWHVDVGHADALPRKDDRLPRGLNPAVPR